jgi:ribonuclease I
MRTTTVLITIALAVVFTVAATHAAAGGMIQMKKSQMPTSWKVLRIVNASSASSNNMKNTFNSSELKMKHGDCDYYVLALDKCTDDAPFTIHGLWPQYNEYNWPSFCDPSATYDPNAISDLMSQMNTDWPACNWGHNQTWFLSHEWLKHGTCSQWDEHDYFAAALSIYQSNNWTDHCDRGSSCQVHVTPQY